MSTAAERLKALKQQSQDLYAPTRVADHDPAIAPEPPPPTPQQGSTPTWPLGDPTLFSDLPTARVLYWDPQAQDEILKARRDGKTVVEVQPFSEKTQGIRLWTADGYRLTAQGRKGLRALGFLVRDGCQADRIVLHEEMVPILRKAIEIAEQDRDEKVQRLAASMTAQEFNQELHPATDWLSAFQDNLPIHPPEGLRDLPEHPLPSSEREVPVLEAFLEYIGMPTSGRGANLLLFKASLASGLKRREQIHPMASPLRESTLVDFLRKNQQCWLHQLDDSRCYPHEPLPFHNAEAPGPWNDWAAFHRQWPKHDGLAWVSRIGFSQFDQQAFLHALIITDQRLACQDNAGKSTFSSGLQVLLERSEEGRWEVCDWMVEGPRVRARDRSNPFTLEQSLKILPGFRDGNGETTIPLLSEAEAIFGYADIGGEEVVATTIGLRLRDRLYEYPDLILAKTPQRFMLACLYDDLDLDLGISSSADISLFHQIAIFRNIVTVDDDSELNSYRSALRRIKPPEL